MFPLLNLSLGQWLLWALVVTQLTIFSVTLWLHRSQAHRALDLHPGLAHAMRAWLWLTTGISTKQWVAVHRKHHAHCETEQDPHSPKVLGLATVLFKGLSLYQKARKDDGLVARYSHGAPNDWLENQVYIRHSTVGLVILGLANLVLLGFLPGLLMTGIQLLWIPLWAAGVINGLGHAKGYRNFETADESRNLVPWAVWIGGEELHNNHHAHPTSAKLSYRPWEVDIGWGAILVLQALNLAKVRKAVYRPQVLQTAHSSLPHTLECVTRHRLQIASWYRALWNEALRELNLPSQEKHRWQQKGPFSGQVCADMPPVLQALTQRWADLQKLWSEIRMSKEQLAEHLELWLRSAEAAPVRGLPELAWKLQRIA